MERYRGNDVMQKRIEEWSSVASEYIEEGRIEGFEKEFKKGTKNIC